MVIYEVNLVVDNQIATSFAEWLGIHIEDMLCLPCFESADWYEQEVKDQSDKKFWTVHYRAKSREFLQDYFDNYAVKMRGDGLRLFEGKFTAERRILSLHKE